MKEACGVFGIFAPGQDCARISFFGLNALQHRGQESAGIAVSDFKTIKSHLGMGLVENVFGEEIIKNLGGNLGIGHVRYSTTGFSTIENAQPIVIDSARGAAIALVHNGNLVNSQILRKKMIDQGFNFKGNSDSETIVRKIAARLEKEQDLVDSIRSTMTEIIGAYSLIILTKTKIVALRDPWGIRPLVIGKFNHGFLVASETCAIKTLGGEVLREVMPAEIVVISENGMEVFKGQSEREALCVFEFIYFARPDSEMYGISMHRARRHMGGMLWEEHPVEADIVGGVPETGIPAAQGLAELSLLPCRDVLIKNRFGRRSFIEPDQKLRELGVRIKLAPLRDEIKNEGDSIGKRLIVVEDSIVRATTTCQIIEMLKGGFYYKAFKKFPIAIYF